MLLNMVIKQCMYFWFDTFVCVDILQQMSLIDMEAFPLLYIDKEMLLYLMRI